MLVSITSYSHKNCFNGDSDTKYAAMYVGANSTKLMDFACILHTFATCTHLNPHTGIQLLSSVCICLYPHLYIPLYHCRYIPVATYTVQCIIIYLHISVPAPQLAVNSRLCGSLSPVTSHQSPVTSHQSPQSPVTATAGTVPPSPVVSCNTSPPLRGQCAIWLSYGDTRQVRAASSVGAATPATRLHGHL